MAAVLRGQRDRDRNAEDGIKTRELQDMNEKINAYQYGEETAKINDLERRAQQTKDMRDFYAYKQIQKDLERERA
jgi:GTP cyclohydrolase II